MMRMQKAGFLMMMLKQHRALNFSGAKILLLNCVTAVAVEPRASIEFDILRSISS